MLLEQEVQAPYNKVTASIFRNSNFVTGVTNLFYLISLVKY